MPVKLQDKLQLGRRMQRLQLFRLLRQLQLRRHMRLDIHILLLKLQDFLQFRWPVQ